MCRRIQACPGAVNPNCISTSSTNEMYSPAWRAAAGSSRAALLDLDAAVLGRQDGAIKVLEAETPFGWYAAYSVPGKFAKPDVLEFLLKEQGVTDRNWAGDREGPTVLYRSIAGALTPAPSRPASWRMHWHKSAGRSVRTEAKRRVLIRVLRVC